MGGHYKKARIYTASFLTEVMVRCSSTFRSSLYFNCASTALAGINSIIGVAARIKWRPVMND